VLLTDAEQHLYDTARQILGPSLMVGGDVPELQEWQDEYLFSRIVSVYGGTRQMQLTTIARFLLGLAAGTPR
jgi:alkylation response protein AidB-like acyl-CoA dehydrogenase